MGSAFTAVDLFSGAGGISLGLREADFQVLLANDFNPAAAQTHEFNLPGTQFLPGDVRTITSKAIMKQAGLRRGELDLLIGGPPCQGFSIIGSRLVRDPRNDLFREFLRIASDLQPRCLVIENVPGLTTLAHGEILEEILCGYRNLGYSATFAELLAAQYGVPQMRWRLVIIGFRRDIDVPPRMGFPRPTHGRTEIGALVPNCTISAADLEGFVTTRDAIGDLPPIAAGQEVSNYFSKPQTPYQQEMRRGLTTELSNHYAPRLSVQNIERIAALQAGQDWRDLPRKLLPPGMRRAKRKDHTRRYSRMTWEGVPRSIITRFRDPKSGEYSHPDQDRTISIREAARIQSFPDSFVFLGNHSEQYDQVGNAVPPKLAFAIGREVRACLTGSATYSVPNAFPRRPSYAQAKFRFALGNS